MLGGMNHILFYSAILLEQAGIPRKIVPTVTIGIFAIQVIASFIGVKMLHANIFEVSKPGFLNRGHRSPGDHGAVFRGPRAEAFIN